MKNNIEIISLNNEIDIFRVMCLLSDSFFDQKKNNEETIKMLSEKFSKAGNFFYASIENTVVGFVAFYANDTIGYTGYLSMIIVEKNNQRMGIGKKLMDVCLDECCRLGMKKLCLEVNVNNVRAITMYEKMGFILKEKHNLSLVMEKAIEV